MIDRARFRSIERWTMLLAAVLSLSAFVLGGRTWGLSVSLGAGLMILNTLATRMVGEKLLRTLRPDAQAVRGQQIRTVVLFNLKMAAVLVAVYLVVRFLHVQPVGLIVGLSVYPLGAVLSALLDQDQQDGNAPVEGQHG